MLKLTIPWACLCSDNKRHTRRGGRGHGWEYKAARDAINLAGLDAIRGERPRFSEPVWVRLDYYLPDLRRRDVSNTVKVLFDGLNKVVWADDSLIKDFGFLVHPPDGSEPRVEIRVGLRTEAL